MCIFRFSKFVRSFIVRYFLAILAIIITHFILSGIIVGPVLNGNLTGNEGLLTALIMIPISIFLWKIIVGPRSYNRKYN